MPAAVLSPSGSWHPLASLGARLRQWQWWRRTRAALIVAGSPALKWDAVAAHQRQRLTDLQGDPRWGDLTSAQILDVFRHASPRVISASPDFWAHALLVARRDPRVWTQLHDWYVLPSHLPPQLRRQVSTHHPTSRFTALLQRTLAALEAGRVAVSAQELEVLAAAPAAVRPVLDVAQVKPLLTHELRVVRQLGVQLLADASPPAALQAADVR